MTKDERNRIATIKGSVRRARNSLDANIVLLSALPDVSARVGWLGPVSTSRAAREIGSAVADLDTALLILEAVLQAIDTKEAAP